MSNKLSDRGDAEDDSVRASIMLTTELAKEIDDEDMFTTRSGFIRQACREKIANAD